MATNTIWLLVPLAAVLALGLIGALETQIPATSWWICIASVASLLALWKYFARRRLSHTWNPDLSEVDVKSARLTAYLFLAGYFLIGGGFIAIVIASIYSGFAIPVEILIGFFATWFVRFEIWGLLLDRTRKHP